MLAGRHINELYKSSQKLLSSNVEINFKMLCPFRKYEIDIYVEFTLAIAKQDWKFGIFDVHVLQ